MRDSTEASLRTQLKTSAAAVLCQLSPRCWVREKQEVLKGTDDRNIWYWRCFLALMPTSTQSNITVSLRHCCPAPWPCLTMQLVSGRQLSDMGSPKRGNENEQAVQSFAIRTLIEGPSGNIGKHMSKAAGRLLCRSSWQMSTRRESHSQLTALQSKAFD